jgi:hypothetical protein
MSMQYCMCNKGIQTTKACTMKYANRSHTNMCENVYCYILHNYADWLSGTDGPGCGCASQHINIKRVDFEAVVTLYT